MLSVRGQVSTQHRALQHYPWGRTLPLGEDIVASQIQVSKHLDAACAGLVGGGPTHLGEALQEQGSPSLTGLTARCGAALSRAPPSTFKGVMGTPGVEPGPCVQLLLKSVPRPHLGEEPQRPPGFAWGCGSCRWTWAGEPVAIWMA